LIRKKEAASGTGVQHFENKEQQMDNQREMGMEIIQNSSRKSNIKINI